MDLISGVVPVNLEKGCSASMKESLCLSAMRYPLGKHYFLGTGETPLALRMTFERFSRILSQFLSEQILCGDLTERDAVEIGKGILSGNAYI